jgi:glucose 1-dehydrogenase
MRTLEGKVAVVTGGTRGFGLAIASALADAGAAVMVASRSQPSVDDAVSRLRAQGHRSSGLIVDVSDILQVQALADRTLQEFGQFDIWVNNAGTAGPYGPTVDLTPEAFCTVIETNILGVYNGSRTAMRHFLAQRSGKLINILGAGSDRPVPNQNAYGSSKMWVRTFTLALAKENQGSGVGVFAFHPGMMLTDLLTDVEVVAGLEERMRVFPTIVRMWARPPEQPAQKVVWVASSATDGQTGRVIHYSNLAMMLGGALREGVRALLKRPAPPLDMRTKSVPPAAK